MIPFDSEQHVKDAICQYLNENPQGDFPVMEAKNIITLRISEDNIITLVDCNIKGVPKFTIPADKLEFNPKPISELKPKVKRSVNGRRKRGAKK